MSVWNEFAALIGVAPRHAEDALHSERAARASLSRRGLFGASAALAAGVAFGFPATSAEAGLGFVYRGVVMYHNGEWYDVFQGRIGPHDTIYFDTDGLVIQVGI